MKAIIKQIDSEKADLSGFMFFLYRGVTVVRDPLECGGTYYIEDADIAASARFNSLEAATAVVDASTELRAAMRKLVSAMERAK